MIPQWSYVGFYFILRKCGLHTFTHDAHTVLYIRMYVGPYLCTYVCMCVCVYVWYVHRYTVVMIDCID